MNVRGATSSGNENAMNAARRAEDAVAASEAALEAALIRANAESAGGFGVDQHIDPSLELASMASAGMGERRD